MSLYHGIHMDAGMFPLRLGEIVMNGVSGKKSYHFLLIDGRWIRLNFAGPAGIQIILKKCPKNPSWLNPAVYPEPG